MARNPLLKSHTKLRKLILQGQALPLMGQKVGLTRERVRQIINRDGLYDSWREARKIKIKQEEVDHKNELAVLEQKKPLIKDICTILTKRRDELVKQEPWPSKIALEYLFSRKLQHKGLKTYEPLRKMYEIYQISSEKGVPASLSQMAKYSGMRESIISVHLSRAGLPTLSKNYSVVRRKYSSDELSLFQRCSNTVMPCSDISYFTGYPVHSIRFNSEKPRSKGLTHMFFGRATYRKAFEAYEAKQLGFSNSEISELLNLEEDALNYLLRDEKKIKQTITKDLKEIYQNNIPKKYNFLFK